jgi:hypothetical protein
MVDPDLPYIVASEITAPREDISLLILFFHIAGKQRLDILKKGDVGASDPFDKGVDELLTRLGIERRHVGVIFATEDKQVFGLAPQSPHKIL